MDAMGMRYFPSKPGKDEASGDADFIKNTFRQIKGMSEKYCEQRNAESPRKVGEKVKRYSLSGGAITAEQAEILVGSLAAYGVDVPGHIKVILDKVLDNANGYRNSLATGSDLMNKKLKVLERVNYLISENTPLDELTGEYSERDSLGTEYSKVDRKRDEYRVKFIYALEELVNELEPLIPK